MHIIVCKSYAVNAPDMDSTATDENGIQCVPFLDGTTPADSLHTVERIGHTVCDLFENAKKLLTFVSGFGELYLWTHDPLINGKAMNSFAFGS